MIYHVRNAFAFVIPIVLGVVCIGVSVSVMNGLEDCWRDDSHHGPSMISLPNCADDRTLLTRDVFLFLGIILILAPLAASILIDWRKARAEEAKIRRLNFPN